MSAKKRFYTTVDVSEDAAGFGVTLDGRAVRSPAGTLAQMPSRPLAEAVAAEWQAQEQEIEPASMPLFSLTVTVIDRVTPQRAAILHELEAYGGNDLLCYHDSDDAALAARQQTGWMPWIDWARDSLGANLQVASGIMPVSQSSAARAALAEAAASFDDWVLGMLHRTVTLGGSLVLGLAFLKGRMDANALFEATFLDELWQAEKWGSDWEAEDRRAGIKSELADAERFLHLVRVSG